MEQFVLVLASVYNKSAQFVTKRELPKYKAEQPPTYQIGSLNLNKKLFGKADPLIDKILPCSRSKLPISQTIILDSVDTGVLNLNFTFASKKSRRYRHLLYFTRHCWNITLSSFYPE